MDKNISSSENKISEAIKEREKMLRRESREHHENIHEGEKTHQNDFSVEESKERIVVLGPEDVGEDDLMEYSDLNLPSDIVEEFDRLGYKVAIIGIKKMNKNKRKGWIPVKKSFIPRWSAHFIPIGEPYEESMDEYCTFGDMVVMIIKKSRWAEIESHYKKNIKDDLNYAAQAAQNGAILYDGAPGKVRTLSGNQRYID